MSTDSSSFLGGKPPERIVVIKLRELGDVLLTTPVFSALRQLYPSAELIAAVYAGTDVMLKGNPDIHKVLRFPKSSGSTFQRWRGRLALGRELRTAAPELALEITKSDAGVLLSKISGARVRIGFKSGKGFIGRNRMLSHPISRPTQKHTVLQNLSVLEPLGWSGPAPRLTFNPRDDARRSLDRRIPPARVAHVHAVSRLFRKHWPIASWATLLEDFVTRGFLPVLTSSADEEEIAWNKELLSATKAACFDLSGQLSLHEVGALSERAEFFAGVDSAPMHMAAAVGTPVIGLFGPSNEQLWHPWCDRYLVLSQEMPCRMPCKDSACSHINCLNLLSPRVVLPRVHQFLDTLPKPDRLCAVPQTR